MDAPDSAYVAGVIAHELGHCLSGSPSEELARRYERWHTATDGGEVAVSA
jgi:hypothetical protein